MDTCYLCRSLGVVLYQGLRDQLFGTPGTWNYYGCPQCGLIWLDTRPEPQYVDKLYERYYTHVAQPRRRFAAGTARAINNAILTRRGYQAASAWQSILGWLLGAVRPLASMSIMSTMGLSAEHKGRLLDVGCGNGYFLSRMRELGWTVQGVEPDHQAAMIAQREYDVPVLTRRIEDGGLPPEYFDVITMRHVIEHLPDPLAALRVCYNSLKPGGKLAIATPNSAALGHHALGRWWRELDPPRHFFLFSPSTLSACVVRAGFRPIYLHQAARLASDIWTASRVCAGNPGTVVGPSPPASRLLRLQAVLFRMVEELALAAGRTAGEEMLLVATRER